MGRAQVQSPPPAASAQPFWTFTRVLAAAGCVALVIGLLAMRSRNSGDTLKLAGGVSLSFGMHPPTTGAPAGGDVTFVEKVPEYTLDLTKPPFVPDKACPNAFVFHTIPAGLGHRVASFALAVAGALVSNAAVAIEASMLVSPRQHEDKDEYPFIAQFFNLGAFAAVSNEGQVAGLPWGIKEQAHTNIYTAQRRARTSCGVAYEYSTGYAGCNPERRRGLGAADADADAPHERGGGAARRLYCMMKSHPRALQNASAVMRPLFNAGNYSKRPVPLFAAAYAATPRALTVAWHVRNGDERKHENAALYQSVHALLTKAAAEAKIPLAHTVFSQHEITADGKYGYTFLLTLPEFAGVPRPRPPTDEALLHLVKADVLVHCGGSSFSYAASLVAPASQVSIAAPPKEQYPGGNPGASDMYFMDGTFRVTTDGALLPPGGGAEPAGEEARLTARLRERYEAVTGRRGN